MSKFHCRCGHTIILRTEVDPEENTLINQVVIDKQVNDMDDNNKTLDAEGLLDFLYDQGIEVIICPECKRVYFDNNDDGPYTAYVNEDNPPDASALNSAPSLDQEGYLIAEALTRYGYNVMLKQDPGKGTHDLPTADMDVEGIGLVDVLTPETSEVGRIASRIGKPHRQAPVVMVNVELDTHQMIEISKRVWDKPGAENLRNILFLASDGKITVYSRPRQ